MEIKYVKSGDYLIPNIIPNIEPEEELTKYGMIYEDWLKTAHKYIWDYLYCTGQAKKSCLTVQHEADELEAKIMPQMMESEGITDELKNENPMEWVRKMNNLQHRVNEIVMDNFINNPEYKVPMES